MKKFSNLAGKDMISWIPTNDFISFERAKELLDLNVNNSSQFMIFKQKPGIDGYVCVITDVTEFVEKI
jgi:hypothetical protein